MMSTTHEPCCPEESLVRPSVLLRRFTLQDSARIFELSQEPGLRRWIPDQVYADEAEARQVLQLLISCYEEPGTPRLGPYVLGVCCPDSGELIGHVGLSPLGDEVEIGYAVAEQQQGRGVATEAVRRMAAWGLEHFGLPRLLGVVAADNAASCRVLEKAGFILIEEADRPLHGRTRRVRIYASFQTPASGSSSRRPSPPPR